MIDLNKNNIYTVMSILVLVLGFQNCGNSSFQNMDSVRNEPASSLLPSDTKFRGGLDFEIASLSSASQDLRANFKISKNKDRSYAITNESANYKCSFENPNSAEELLQITEISTLSHPSMISSAFDLCDSSDGKDVFFGIGRQSKIYLTFKSETEDCFTGDPQKLLDLDKRVFVVDNLFIEDVQELIDSVKQGVLNDSQCREFVSDEAYQP